MTPPSNEHQIPPLQSAKLITCVMLDDGSDKSLLRALRREKQIINASSTACRGVSALERAVSKRDRLPEPIMVRIVEVAVLESQADDVFEFIHEFAGIGHKGGGILHMGPLTGMTLAELPEGVPDEDWREEAETGQS